MNPFFRFSRFILGLTAVCLLSVTACTAVVEEPSVSQNTSATIVPTREIMQETSTAVEVEVVSTEVPTKLPEPEPTATIVTVTEEGTATEESRESNRIAISNDVQFTLKNQWGGTLSAVTVADNVAYIGAGPRLLAVDISNPDQASQLGQSDLLPDRIQAIVVSDGIATVANGRGGIARFDISNPAQIRLLDQTNDFGDISGSVNSVAVADDLIFATSYEAQTGQGHLLVIDAADLQSQASQPLTNVSRVYVQDGVVYLLGYDNLQTFNRDNIAQALDQFDFAASSWQPTLVFVNDLAAISPVLPGGLQMVDVSDPTNLQAVGEAAEDGTFRMGGTAVAAEDTVFMGGTFGEFGFCGSAISAFAVSDPASPQADSPFDPQNCINGMAFAGETLLVSGRSGLQLYDASDPANLVLHSTFVPENGLMDAQSIVVDGRSYYTSQARGQGARLEIYDASEAGTLSPFAEPFDLEASLITHAYLYNLTYVAPVWQDGLRLAKVNDPANPTLDGRLTGEDIQTGDFLVSAFYNGYLYLPTYGAQGSSIAVIDVRDAANPTVVTEVKAVHPQVLDMAQTDSRLYVLNQEATQIVQIFDLSDPANPVEVGQIELPRAYGRITAVGDYLYAACDIWNCQHLAIVDVSNPAQSTLVKEAELPLGVIKMLPIDGQTIVLAVNGDGLYALDITNPVEPVLAGHQPIAGEYYGLAAQGNEIVVAAQDAGLYKIEMGR